MKSSVRKADYVFSPAKCLAQKIMHMYKLNSVPQFLPTPVPLPDSIEKSPTPKVCYIGRLDRRKRPEFFFELVRQFPEVIFVVMGKSRDALYEKQLREKYQHIKNISWLGFVNQFESNLHAEVLSSSWILVNTASREGLPNSFIEGAAHGCAILSSVNPDNFAGKFGCHVTDDDFASALKFLLVLRPKSSDM